jgi:hypothetical protein
MELIEDYDQLQYAEEEVLYSAFLFLNGEQDWNNDVQVDDVCHLMDFDCDFVWLAKRVLFEDAVRFMLTKPYRYEPESELL